MCTFVLFTVAKALIIIYPMYIFQNIVLISISQLAFIFFVSKIDDSLETIFILFLFVCLTIVVAIGYFYLPFMGGMAITL